MLTEERRHVRAKLANASARAATDPQAAEEAQDLRQQYRFLGAQDYIRKLVDEAPPLTDEQRDRLALLLRGGGTA